MNYIENAVFEHQFWLTVMGDHSKFIHDSLYPSEKEAMDKSAYFIQKFNEYRNKVGSLDQTSIPSFSIAVEKIVLQLKDFKLSIIKRKLKSDIKINLTSTFLKHMVKELEEYQLVLSYLKMGNIPPVYHELHDHLIWLLDTGTNEDMDNRLDEVEKRLTEKSLSYSKHFDQFYSKAVELTGYLRANKRKFPTLKRFNNDEVKRNLFKTFLNELKDMDLNEDALGTFTVSMADHMAREEQYYLTKIAESRNVH